MALSKSPEELCTLSLISMDRIPFFISPSKDTTKYGVGF